MEVWKKIKGFSRYEASSIGRLRSNNYKNSKTTKILKPALSVDGYLKTMLQNDLYEYKSMTVHYFVTLAFYGEKPNGIEVNHKNGIKTDNSISNLEYCTRSENINHGYRTGLIKPRAGSLNGMAKLNEEQVREIRKHASENGRYYGRKMLAEKYGVSECTIKEVVIRRKNKFYTA